MPKLRAAWAARSRASGYRQCAFCAHGASAENPLRFCEGWVPYTMRRICRGPHLPRACLDQQFCPECQRKSSAAPAGQAPAGQPPPEGRDGHDTPADAGAPSAGAASASTGPPGHAQRPTKEGWSAPRQPRSLPSAPRERTSNVSPPRPPYLPLTKPTSREMIPAPMPPNFPYVANQLLPDIPEQPKPDNSPFRTEHRSK